MAEYSFDEEMHEIAVALEEILNHTEDEKIIFRLESVKASLKNLQALYDEASENRDAEVEAAAGAEPDTEAEVNAGADAEAEPDSEAEAAAEAALDEWEEFELRYGQLAGLAEQFSALGRKRPESACGTFKAQQVNRVLRSLRELMEEDMGLVSEEGEQSYSDVSLLIRSYMDLCAFFASREYGRSYDFRGREISSGTFGYGHR